MTTGAGAGANGIGIVECPTCGSRVPSGQFCGACGTELAGKPGSSRTASFAADPGERVARPWLLSTLFPYLPHRELAPFGLILLIGVGALVMLGLLRLAGPAIIGSAVLLPVLYLLYFYEAGVYEDQPWLVIGATLLLGIVLGVVWVAVAGPLATQALIHSVGGQLGPGELALAGVVVPLAALVLTLVGPAVLYVHGRFREALDGFTFGAASALGLGFATTIWQLTSVLGHAPVLDVGPLGYTLEVIRDGLVAPIVSASLAGLVAAAMWLRREPAGLRLRGRRTRLSHSLAIAVFVTVGLGLLDIAAIDGRIQFIAWTTVGVVLLIVVRQGLHEILLAEARETLIGAEIACSHCGNIVPEMPFCPSCGISRRATPKLGRISARGGGLGDRGG